MISRPFDSRENLQVPDQQYLQSLSTEVLCTEITALARRVTNLPLRPSAQELREVADKLETATLQCFSEEDASFKQIAAVFSAFGRMGVQPSQRFQDFLNREVARRIHEEGIPGPESAVSILHACAQLRMDPPKALLQECLENYADIFETESQKQRSGGLFLQDLAMLHANNPSLFPKEEVGQIQFFLAPKNPRMLEHAEREQHYIAASYFESRFLAAQLYEGLQSRELTNSKLQDGFAQTMREAIKRTSSTATKSIHLSEEQVLPCLGSNVDLCLTVTGYDGRESKLWIQVDGPHHYFADANGEMQLDGSSHLQNVIAEREGHKMERVSYQDLRDRDTPGIFARNLISAAIASHAARENTMVQTTTEPFQKKKRPRISGPRPAFSAGSSGHSPTPDTPRPSFQR